MDAVIGYLAEVMLVLWLSIFVFLAVVVPWTEPWLKPHRHDDSDDAATPESCPHPTCPVNSRL